MNEEFPKPHIPTPGPTYNRNEVEQALRAIDEWIQQLLATGTISFQRALVVGLPTSGYGLRVGELYSHAGVLSVVRSGEAFPNGGVEADAEQGSVTVSTS